MNKIIIASCIAFATALAVPSISAGMDCTPLDPRASILVKKEANVQASVKTLFKIAKTGGRVEAKVKKEIQNLQKGASLSEQGQIKLRTLYLFCEMVANSNDLTTERKVALYGIMMKQNVKTDNKDKKPTGKKSEDKSMTKSNLPIVPPTSSAPASSTPGGPQSPSQISQNMNNSPNALQVLNTGSGNVTVTKETPPRGFSSEQFQTISNILQQGAKGKIFIDAINADNETYEFAKSIRTVFASAGWKTGHIPTGQVMGAPMKGVTVEIDSDDKTSKPMKSLYDLLISAGFIVRLSDSCKNSSLFPGECPHIYIWPAK